MNVPVLLLGAVALVAFPISAQTGTTAEKPALNYDLVSIHLSKPDAQGYDLDNSPDGMEARAINLRQLVSEAYGFTFGELLEGQIVNLPEWGKSQRFDIHAKVDVEDVSRLKAARDAETMAVWVQSMVSRKPTTETAMLQHLMEDRFHIKVHYEQRTMPVYALTVAKGGLKMKPAHPADPEHGSMSFSNGKMSGENVPPVFLTFLLMREAGRPVVDRTGIPGRYDFQMNYTPDAGMRDTGASDTGPSLFTAIEEDLGLKLVPAKEPVWVVVIDHVEMPGDN